MAQRKSRKYNVSVVPTNSPLKQLRLRARLSQEGLAEIIDSTAYSIRRWEKGKAEPTLTIWQTKKLCVALKTSFYHLPDSLMPIENDGVSHNVLNKPRRQNPRKYDISVVTTSSPLKRLRLLAKLSKQRLVNAIGCSLESITRWERGDAEPKLTILQTKQLCESLNVNFYQLPDSWLPTTVDDDSYDEPVKHPEY
jgi:putative transcriptional regulator